MHVSVISLTCAAVQSQIARVGGEALEGGLGHTAEDRDRVVAGGLPKDWIHAAEQVTDGRLPAPQDVVGELGNPLQRGRQSGPHKKLPKWLNLKRHGIRSGHS
jgi:hypothetical protein